MPRESFKDTSLLTEILREVPKIINDTCNSLASSPTDLVELNHFRNAFDEAYQELESKGFLDLTFGKLLYSTPSQVRYFAGFIPEQSDLESLLGFFDKHNEKFPKEFDIRAYCCGNAVKEGLVFLNEFQSGRAKRIFLHDYSRNVTTVGLNVVAGLLALLHKEDPLDKAVRSFYTPQIIMDDETDIEQHLPKRLKKSKREKVHVLLGNMISLANNPNEVAISINKTMKKGELFVQEWYDRKPGDYNTGKLLQSNKDFLLNYFEAMGISRDHIRFDQDQDGNGLIMEDYEGKYNQAYCFLAKDCPVNGYELKAGTKLVGMRLRRFKEDEVISLFASVGLEATIMNYRVEYYNKSYDDFGSDKKAALDASWIPSLDETSSLTAPPETKRKLITQRWEEHGDKKYAIFRKIKEHDPKRWLRRSLLATAMAVGITVGGYFLNPVQNKYCPNAQVHDIKIQCKLGEETRSLDINDISDLVITNENSGILQAEGMANGIKYHFEFAQEENAAAFKKLHQISTEADTYLKKRNQKRCISLEESLVGHKLKMVIPLKDKKGIPTEIEIRALPPGASYRIATSGDYVISWTPTKDQIGEHQIEVVRTDYAGKSSADKVDINVVSAPAINTSEQGFQYLADCGSVKWIITKTALAMERYKEHKVDNIIFQRLLPHIAQNSSSHELLPYSLAMFDDQQVITALNRLQVVSERIKNTHEEFQARLFFGPMLDRQFTERILQHPLIHDGTEDLSINSNPLLDGLNFLDYITSRKNFHLSAKAKELVDYYSLNTSNGSRILVAMRIIMESGNFFSDSALDNLFDFYYALRDREDATRMVYDMTSLLRTASIDNYTSDHISTAAYFLLGISEDKKNDHNLAEVLFEVRKLGQLFSQVPTQSNRSWLNTAVVYAKVLEHKCVKEYYLNLLRDNKLEEMDHYRASILQAIYSSHPDIDIQQRGSLGDLIEPDFPIKQGLCP